MHELFANILAKRDLSRAGELFSVEDDEIVPYLNDVLLEISNIVSQPQYLSSKNDQSVVEICVNRCTSCIRETNTAEEHCSGLVQLLEICYQFNHKPSSRRREDPPHAKLSSDLISCIFLNYNKKAVMEQALPIAVKFLDKENEEMSKNLAAYLSLAAIEYTNLLTPYVDIILRSLLNGNYSLSRVVLQLYDYGKERPIMSRTKSILDILSKCEATSDKNILLQLIGNIVNHMVSDDLTEVIDKIPQIFDLVLDTTSANQALIVLLRLAEKRPSAFHEYIDLFILTAQKLPGTVCLIGQILATVGKKNKQKASIALDFIMENLPELDRSSQTILLQEAVKLCSFYPILFNDKLTAAIRQHTNQKTNSQSQLSGNNITIVNLNSSTLIPLRTSQNQPVSLKSQQVSTTYINNQTLGSKNSPFNAPHYSRKQKIDSRSTGRLNNNNNNSSAVSTNRSMTKLNSNGNSSNKSMTRLSSSQHIHQSHSVVSSILNSSNIDSNISTQPPPLSQHVTITGENKWGIPSIKSITSGGVTLQYTSPNKIRPYSMTGNGFSSLNQSTGSINNQNNVVFIQQNNSGHSNTTSTSISPPTTTRDSSLMESQVVISGPTSTQVTSRKNTNHNKSVTLLNINNNVNHRMSVFEPHMRDTIQHFCEKHLEKIKSYMKSVSNRLPPACKITIEERRSKKFAKIHFACQARSNSHCLYSKTFFTMRTRFPKTWIHLMFLDLQSRVSHQALSSYDPGVSSLKHCWDTLKIENKTFITLVTSAFPVARDQDAIINELRNFGFFDVFEVGPSLNLSNNSSISLVEDQLRWACFLCNHPEKAMFLENNAQPVIEGQLKEKKGKWRLFKRWRTRYFTLSGAHLSCKNSNGNACTLDINQIRSVKVQRGARNIPTCFEIFAENQTLILKPTDGEKAEEWAQYLNIVLAKQRDGNRNKASTLGSRREI